ncbi:cytochrome c oxidase assembly factor CtaG [Bacillus sp. PS06]|uniref:cytochrome c oxidase assembly factor CtaG n=1 Tax=Bacillus sp. PS06 TaxID=2764176 RepID=UPI0017835604|nr:cytochrome c oxidase assembly factor CtaG [Bacillus sp. PS06]MBD8068427.1 cytochrome c oxidase assembly factor CtaG [Bacillus sp. PS06]
MSIDIFGFRALWSPYFFLVILAITVGYFLLIGPLRNRFSNTEKATNKQITFFTIAMLLVYVCKGSPVDLLGHLMFSAHMTQMAVLYLVVPPLLILGLPHWILRLIVNNRFVKPFFKFLTLPLFALLFFNGVFSFYHIPLIFDVVKTDMLLHAFTTAVLFIASIMMWWPLINPLPEWQTLNGLKRVGYIFADGILLTPACALIIFADTPLYATYTDPTAWATALELCVPASMLASIDLVGPQMFNSLPLVEDQQLGGVIMKIIQEIVYGTILGVIFFQWVRKEQEVDEVDADLLNPQPIK